MVQNITNMQKNKLGYIELEIGEQVSLYDSEVVIEVVESTSCIGCVFHQETVCPFPCTQEERDDNKRVIYKRISNNILNQNK